MIDWVNHVLIAGIGDLMRSARTNYGVDPVVFLVIYLASGPFFYYSIFRMVRAMVGRKRSEVTFWSTIFLASSVAPFLYVLFFGHHLPWWAYGVIALLVGQGIYFLVRKLMNRQVEPDPGPELSPRAIAMTVSSAAESPVSAASPASP